MLELRQIRKTYEQGDRQLEILKGLNLTLQKGTTLAILGPSGSGKSTLLSLLAGLDSPTSGEIRVSGVSLVGLSEKAITEFRGRNIGIVFQQFHLLPHLTALENVELPLFLLGKKEARQKALFYLEKVGLADRADHFPSQLSGGEQQRVAIARALAPEPNLILADEPSGNLDEEIGQEVMDLLFGVVREFHSTLVLVTHNEELAARCDRQVRLHHGTLE